MGWFAAILARMKLNFTYKTLEMAPLGHVRVNLTQEPRGSKKFVRTLVGEGGAQRALPGGKAAVKSNEINTIELGAGKPEDMNLRKFVLLCRSIVRAAHEFKAKK